MILEELVLHDFGVYRDRQVLQFAPPTRERPITLVGGLNGGGKTTLLEALQLALYGPLALNGGRRGLSYEKYLEEMVHRDREPRKGAAVEVAFSTHVAGTAESFRVHRSWTLNGGKAREQLDVIRNGRLDVELTERWSEQVEVFLPRGVAPLFFFDAEQIESFADLDRSQELLSTAVNALLGLDLVERLRSDLSVLERRHRGAAAGAGLKAELAGLDGEIAGFAKNEETAAQALAGAREHVARLEKRAEHVEARFRRDGGLLYEQRQELDSERARIASELREVEGRLRDIAAGPACLLLVEDLLRETAKVATAEHCIEQAHFLAIHVGERDATIVAALRQRGLPAEVLQTITTVLQELTPKANEASGKPLLRMDIDGLVTLQSLLETTLPQGRTALEEQTQSRNTLRARLDESDRRVASIPSSDAIAALIEERERVHGELAAARASVVAAEGQLGEIQRDRADRKRRLERLLEKEAGRQLGEEDDVRIVRHTAKARETLSRFRIEATRRHLVRIERFIQDSLRRLLRKERLIRELRIDPETFSLELRNEQEQVIQPRQLSAGERQLLAISMLWGLAQASGRPLPVIIDTPLGRLDGTHRVHLLERYFPHASHQVVLLSTDDEIDAPALERLRPFVGRSYELRFDDTQGMTEIREGYFW